MPFPRRLPLQIVCALAIIAVGVASLVDLAGGPAPLHRVQSLLTGVILFAWFVAILSRREDRASMGKVATLGLVAATVTIVLAVADLVGS